MCYSHHFHFPNHVYHDLVHPGEPLRPLDGLDELVPELLVGLVRGQVQPENAHLLPVFF